MAIDAVAFMLDNFAAFLSRLCLKHPHCHACDAQAMRDACFWHDETMTRESPYSAKGAQPPWW